MHRLGSFCSKECWEVTRAIRTEAGALPRSPGKERSSRRLQMELNSTDGEPDFLMSEEEDSISCVKRSLKRKLVKHSTPVDSVFSGKTPSLSGPINWSINDQDLSKRAYVSPVPKSALGKSVAQLSLASVEAYFPHTSPKRYSVVFDLQDSSGERSHSSRAVYSRRRLSTVLASDESIEETSEKVASSAGTQTPTKASEKLAGTPKSGSSWMVSGIPGIKDPPVLKKKKTDKAIVRKKQREWVLRQLKNIEEATKHELTIEEV